MDALWPWDPFPPKDSKQHEGIGRKMTVERGGLLFPPLALPAAMSIEEIHSSPRRNALQALRGGGSLLSSVGSKGLLKVDLNLHKKRSSSSSSTEDGLIELSLQSKETESQEGLWIPSPAASSLVVQVKAGCVYIHSLSSKPSMAPTASSGQILTSLGGSTQGLPVGSLYYFQEGPEILQIEWHPLSPSCHLLILSSDGVLRLFNVSQDLQDSEQSWDLSLLSSVSNGSIAGKRTRKLFTTETEQERVIQSFAFPSASSFSTGSATKNSADNENPWDLFTVYCVLGNGDLISLCPIMPQGCALSLGFLWSLKESLSSSPLSSNEIERETPESKLAHWTKRWVQDLQDQWLLQQKRSSQGEGLPSDKYPLNLPKFHSKLGGLKKQGPFLKSPPSPFDEESYLFSRTWITDKDCFDQRRAKSLFVQSLYLSPALAKENKKKQTEVKKNVHLVYLGFEDGTVEIWLKTQTPLPNWDIFSSQDATDISREDSLLLLGALDLGLFENEDSAQEYPSFLRILEFLRDPKYPSQKLYIYHDRGVHCLDTTPLLGALTNSLLIDDSALTGLGEDLVLVEWLFSSKTPVIGLQVCTDIYLGYGLVCLTSDGVLIGKPLSLLTPLVSSNSQKSVQKTGSPNKDVQSIQVKSYPSILREPAFALPSALSGASFQIPAGLVTGMKKKYPEEVDDEMVLGLSRAVSLFRKRVQELLEAGLDIQKRLEQQKQETQAQLKILGEALEYTRSSSSTSSVQERLLKAQTKLTQKLIPKADLILQILFDQTQPELSNAEKDWIEDLKLKDKPWTKEMKKKVTSLDKRKTQVLQESSILSQPLTSSEKRGLQLGDGQIKRIQRSLGMEYELLASLIQRTLKLREQAGVLA